MTQEDDLQRLLLVEFLSIGHDLGCRLDDLQKAMQSMAA